MNFPIFVKISKKQLEEFRGCEQGAEDDNMTDPSGITTMEILNRHKDKIELRTTNECVQVASCCVLGTFPNFCPRVAERIYNELLLNPEVYEAYNNWDMEQANAFRAWLKEACEASQKEEEN